VTVLPTVRRQIEFAAERLATGVEVRAPSERARRQRVVGWALAAASAVVVAVVIVAVARGHHAAPAGQPTATPASGGHGLAAPVLAPGQAWFYVDIEQQTTPWQPPSNVNQLAPPSTVVNAATHAAVVDRAEFRNYILQGGDGRGDVHALGRPRFIGSASERRLWRADGSRPEMTFGSGVSTTIGNGFQIGNRTFSYAQLLHFPTDAAEILGMFPPTKTYPVQNQMNEIGSAFEYAPLPPAARAALFNTLANLRGVQHLGTVRDPLGRSGIAFATSMPAEQAPANGPGAGTGASLPQRAELIFDPTTRALLASETVLLKSTPVPEIKAGYAISWTAYLTSSTLPASAVPKITPPPCQPGSVRLSLGERMAGQTGEHAYVFALTNQSSSACTLDGYPNVTLSSNGHGLRFAYRHGGPPYATTSKPGSVTLQPNGHAYFLLAKYRCDVKIQNTATTMYVAHLGLGGIATLQLQPLHITDLDYFARYRGDSRVDPGNYVDISPFERTIGATIAPLP